MKTTHSQSWQMSHQPQSNTHTHTHRYAHTHTHNHVNHVAKFDNPYVLQSCLLECIMANKIWAVCSEHLLVLFDFTHNEV